MAEADSFDPGVLVRLKQLQDKYAAMGQDLTSYLDGLLHADFPTYWDYINLDTLLSLQQPVPPFPDEQIFVIYHQITELYFKLSLLEIERGPFSSGSTGSTATSRTSSAASTSWSMDWTTSNS